jgi:hypothetical protein
MARSKILDDNRTRTTAAKRAYARGSAGLRHQEERMFVDYSVAAYTPESPLIYSEQALTTFGRATRDYIGSLPVTDPPHWLRFLHRLLLPYMDQANQVHQRRTSDTKLPGAIFPVYYY